ncbi:MAG: uroporphyrinogen decarboxylase family protein [Opitutaceae bacterium]
MMTTPLTSQERMNRAMERRDHDRIPRHDSFWQDTINRWEREGLVGSHAGVLARLDSDIATLNGIFWPHPFPGQRKILAEDENTVSVLDEWGGSTMVFKDHQTTPTHLGWECETREIWYERFRPAIVNQGIRVDVEEARTKYTQAKKEGKWTHITGLEPFESLRKLLGDVSSLMAMAEDPDWIADISEVTTDLSLRNLQAFIDAGIKPDGLWVYGDMAYNHATMCSPDFYRRIVWPSHKRFCDFAHENGMKFIYHTDGDVNGVMDLYLEAGFDCLQPLECKANMDIRNLVPKYGERMSFFGNVDVMAMIDNDLERIEAELVSKITAGKEKKGYIYHSDHSIPPQVSWKTYCALIEMVKKHGDY